MGHLMLEHCNRDREKVEHLMVEQWKRYSGTSDGGTVKRLIVEQSNRDGGSVEQRWWIRGTSDGGTVEHLMVEQWNI